LAVTQGHVQWADVERVRDGGCQSVADALIENGSLSIDMRRAIESLLVLRCATVDHTPIASEATAPRPSSFGAFELICEIARGGMGVVYEARETRLNRVVALKMIRTGVLAGDHELRRFHAEAAAAAKLDHPGIVPVYDAGVFDGRPYYTMALVRGSSLSERIRQQGPLPPHEGARILAAAARAVHFAHAHGIIHRDIKPHNILLDEAGVPRIADFGLAKHLLAGPDLTATGQVMGTPSYMPPEQAIDASAAGAAADVYSLGAALYCTLSGRPPFQAPTAAQTLHQVIHEEPAPPRRLNPDVPPDLETICLKCLRKEPEKRYASAQYLADDLNRYLEGKPIAARPVGTVERAALWAKRRPVAAALGGVSVLAFAAVVGTVVSLVYQSRLSGLNETLTTRNSELNSTNSALTHAEQRASLERDRANEAKARLAESRYASDLAIAGRAWREGDPGRTASLLKKLIPMPGEPDLRGFEWHYLRGLERHDLWQGEVNLALMSPGGKYLIIQRAEGVQLLDPLSRKLLQTFPANPPSLTPIAFSNDDRYVAIGRGSNAFVVRDMQRGEDLKRFHTAELNLNFLAVNSNGTLVASTGLGSDRHGRVWDVRSGELLHTFEMPRSYPLWPAFSPGSDAIAYNSSNSVEVRDLKAGRLRFSRNIGDLVTGHAFHPTEPWLITARSDDVIQVWDVHTGVPIVVPALSQGLRGSHLSFSRDGKRLLTGSSRDRTVRLWDVATGKLLAWRKGHSKPVITVALLPDSGRAFSLAGDGAALWDMTGSQEYQEIPLAAPGASNLRYHPDSASRVLAYLDSQSKIHLRDGPSDRVLNPGKAAEIKRFEFSGDGESVYALNADSTIDVWDVAMLKRQQTVKLVTEAHTFAVHSEGRWLASIGSDFVTHVYDANGAHRHSFSPPQGEYPSTSIAFQPGTDNLVLAHFNKESRVIRLGADVPRVESIRGPSRINYSFTFSTDGRRVAVPDLTFSVAAFPELTPIVELHGHTDSPLHHQFFPDGRRLASVSSDGTLRIWDLASGQEVLMLDSPDFGGLAISPDGRRIAVCGASAVIRVWDSGKGYE
jgi:serine/threonine protein kinase/WD40 repeat protein